MRAGEDGQDLFVGRTRELARLHAWRGGTGKSRVFVVAGDPGVGKSRLASEFVATVPAYQVTQIAISPTGADNPFEALLTGLGLSESYGSSRPTSMAPTHPEIQARMTPWGSSTVASISDAVAAKVGDHTVEVRLEGELLVDGQVVVFPTEGVYDLGNGAFIERSGTTYSIAWPGTEELRPRMDVAYKLPALRIYPYLPPSMAGQISGLLGNADTDPANDFAARGGGALPQPVPLSLLYGAYADSWRITNQESLFTYATGETTDTFTDLSFPTSIPRVSSLDPEEWAAAEAICRAAGIINPVILDACVLDLVLTGDTSFVEGAIGVREPVAATAGVYEANFDDATAPGFTNTIISTLGDRTYLGPQASTSNTLLLQDLPPHSEAALSFDLLVQGPWTGTSGGDTFTVTETNSGQVFNATLSNTTGTQSYPVAGSVPQSGASEATSSLSVYTLTANFAHWQQDLELQFAGSGLSAAGGQFWGIDNVSIQTNILVPQILDYTLGDTATASIGFARGENRHVFDVPAGGQFVKWDWQECFAGTTAQLYGPDGQPLPGLFGCRDAYLNLVEGSYSLTVSASTAVTGDYTFNVSETEFRPTLYSEAVTSDPPLLYQRFDNVDGTDAVNPDTPAVYGPSVDLSAAGAALSEPTNPAARIATAGTVATIDSTGLPVGAEARTLELWFRGEPASGERWLLNYGNYFGLVYAQNGTLITDVEGVSSANRNAFGLPVGMSLTDGVWHHVVLSYDGVTLRVYVDAVLVGQVDRVVDTVLDRGLVLGDSPGDYAGVAVYPTALGPAQGQARWDAGR